jgi:hypothetical protein
MFYIAKQDKAEIKRKRKRITISSYPATYKWEQEAQNGSP